MLFLIQFCKIPGKPCKEFLLIISNSIGFSITQKKALTCLICPVWKGFSFLKCAFKL